MAHAAECYSTTPSTLGEGPVWDPASASLFAIDCTRRMLMRHDAPGPAHDSWQLPRTPGSFALRVDGSLLMAYRRGLALIAPGTGRLDDVPSPEIDFGVAVFNDGKCDRRGRFWTGTMDREANRPLGALYRVDADFGVHRMDTGVTLSNGIAWSPDDRTMYHCDSRPGLVHAYDYDIATGEIANKRLFVDFRERRGQCDGCTVDAEGGLWVVEIGAGQVVRFDPAGREVDTVAMPVTRPTSVAFGGSDLRTLFITSMRLGLSDAEAAAQPQAGCIFAADAGVAGLPEPRFAG